MNGLWRPLRSTVSEVSAERLTASISLISGGASPDSIMQSALCGAANR